MNLDENVRTMLRERAGSVAAAPVVPERTVRRMQMRKAFSTGGALALVAVVGVAGAFFVRSAFSSDAAPLQPASTPDAEETPQDINSIPNFAPLETGTYYIDPDDDPSTPLRVVYSIAADGWSQWIGAVKDVDSGHVGVSITTVTNLVRHGCRDHSPLDTPVGPTVDDLATALAGLPPFRVTSPPADTRMYGYPGKHLELRVPDLPTVGTEEALEFARCGGGNLHSWISPHLGAPHGDSFWGYTGPDHTEDFWILDVEGTRLVIETNSSPTASAKDLAELRAILDSIRIEP